VPRALRSGPARFLAASAVVAALVGGTAACGGSSDKAGPTGKEAGGTAAPRNGGVLTIAMPTESRGLDPFVGAEGFSDATRLQSLYDVLFWVDPGSGEVRPQIGESLTPDAESRVWTLKLRGGVKFSDGTPYDAAAVKFTWDEHVNPARRSTRAAMLAGTSTEVVDPLTLRVTLAAPNAVFDRVVAANLSHIVSPTAFRADPDNFGSKPVGAGPFVFKEWLRGDHQTFTRNPNYWQAGKPYLDELTFKTIADSRQVQNTVATGQADMSVSSNGQAEAQMRKRGLNVSAMPQYGAEMIVFNQAKPPFDDPRARRAVALALDMAMVDKFAFEGEGHPANGLFPDKAALTDPSATLPSNNRAEAQKLFEELAAEGKKVDFAYLLPQNASSRRTSEYIQSVLQQFPGVTMRLDSLEVPAYMAKMYVQRDYQAGMTTWYLADPEPGLYKNLHSKSPNNYLNYNSPETDRLIDASRTARTTEERRAAYAALNRQLAQDVPVVPYQQTWITAYHKTPLTQLVLTGDGGVLMDRLAFPA
jgi:peptide/nickel transport system substrate-binding protein